MPTYDPQRAGHQIRISELIQQLTAIQHEYGDIEVRAAADEASAVWRGAVWEPIDHPEVLRDNSLSDEPFVVIDVPLTEEERAGLFADGDAAIVCYGARLGGSLSVSARMTAAIHAVSGPVTVADLERALRPDLDPDADPPSRDERYDYEQVGMAWLSAPDASSGAAGAGWVIAAAGVEWLGSLLFDSRQAALFAYGYVLAGQEPGDLTEVLRYVRGIIGVSDVEAFVAGRNSDCG